MNRINNKDAAARKKAEKYINSIPWVSASNALFYWDTANSKGLKSLNGNDGFSMSEYMIASLFGMADGYLDGLKAGKKNAAL